MDLLQGKEEQAQISEIKVHNMRQDNTLVDLLTFFTKPKVLIQALNSIYMDFVMLCVKIHSSHAFPALCIILQMHHNLIFKLCTSYKL